MSRDNTRHLLREQATETAQRLARHAARTTTPLHSGVEVSFEFFPPADDAAEASLWHSIELLAPFAPRFVSVTYGAGGSTRERTHATVERVLGETVLTPAAHLTCVAASRAEVDGIAAEYWASGVRHVVALRGDPAAAARSFTPHPDGYANAAELVAGLTRVAPFELSVAAYPEVHPEAHSASADLDHLKRKIDAGATRAITQFFFDADTYLRFLDRARAAGIEVPIVPGILPVTNFARVLDFARRCGATVPEWMADLFTGLDDAPEVRSLVAATVAAELCTRLRDHGVNEFHFYTLNRSATTRALCLMLGVRPRAATTPAASRPARIGAQR